MINFSSLPFDAADAADILIVAVVIYTALRFLSANRQYFLLSISAIIAGIYFAAHSFGLLLTERLFNLGIAACGIVLAIAFQDDIRRSIHRLANWRPFQHKPVGSDYLDGLAEFAFASAERGIGALIVMKGRDRIDTYLSGGIHLAAPVHPALLDSIFDPHSAGHDGAVVIEDGQITQMGAHLPLGTMFAESAVGGTRHRAALELSELSDAVVIAISEERGTVSIAQSGQLAEAKSPNDLKLRLGPSHDFGGARRKRSMLGVQPFQHAGLKAAALAFATIGWFTMASHAAVVTRTFVVPIEYRNIPVALTLDAAAPEDARLSLSGPEPAFEMLETKSLGVSIDLRQAPAGNVEISLGASNCRHPSDLRVERVNPTAVRLNLVARAPRQS